MDENDWISFLDEMEIAIQEMSNDIQIGIENGHSIDDQFNLLRKVLKAHKN
jgi:hypothetical protein